MALPWCELLVPGTGRHSIRLILKQATLPVIILRSEPPHIQNPTSIHLISSHLQSYQHPCHLSFPMPRLSTLYVRHPLQTSLVSASLSKPLAADFPRLLIDSKLWPVGFLCCTSGSFRTGFAELSCVVWYAGIGSFLIWMCWVEVVKSYI
jgi:hypothetical protein